MIYIRYSVIILFFLLTIKTHSQQLPANRSVNWQLGLSHFAQETPSNSINFYDAGADSTGLYNNDALMASILDTLDVNFGLIIYFPPGKYLFESSINLKSNVIFRGESAETSKLIFDLGGVNDLILVHGSISSISSILTAGGVKDDTTITINNSSLFSIGDYIKLVDQDSDKVVSSWAYQSTGQILKIKAIIGQEITVNSPLRRDFLLSQNPMITKINPINGVGFENLSIDRRDASISQTSHLDFNYSTNCYIKCIKSYNANFAHVDISNSSNCKVEGSYFQDAFAYGSGGQGYGVVLHFSTGECLVYNNIFKHLRHALLLQEGANGNVLSYNYVKDSYWTGVSFPTDAAGDIVLHGNYPYCNLFEGNIVQNIVIDDSHGKNGPYNTFLRNRAELYGIFMNTSAGDSLNFISNEITNTGFLLGLYYLTGTNHFQYGNNRNGIIFSSGTTGLTDSSYYLNSVPPYYLTESHWPPIGIISNYNTYLIESKVRDMSGDLTSCFENNIITDVNHNPNYNIQILPNPAVDYINILNLESLAIVNIYDLSGRKIITEILIPEASKSIDIKGLPAGSYLISVESKSETLFRKKLFIKSTSPLKSSFFRHNTEQSPSCPCS